MKIANNADLGHAHHPIFVLVNGVVLGGSISVFYVSYLLIDNYISGGILWNRYNDVINLSKLCLYINIPTSTFSCFLVSLIFYYAINSDIFRGKSKIFWVFSWITVSTFYIIAGIFYLESPTSSIMTSIIICAAGTMSAAIIAMAAGWFCRKLGATN